LPCFLPFYFIFLLLKLHFWLKKMHIWLEIWKYKQANLLKRKSFYLTRDENISWHTELDVLNHSIKATYELQRKKVKVVKSKVLTTDA
jgi:hypothetical protein